MWVYITDHSTHQLTPFSVYAGPNPGTFTSRCTDYIDPKSTNTIAGGNGKFIALCPVSTAEPYINVVSERGDGEYHCVAEISVCRVAPIYEPLSPPAFPAPSPPPPAPPLLALVNSGRCSRQSSWAAYGGKNVDGSTDAPSASLSFDRMVDEPLAPAVAGSGGIGDISTLGCTKNGRVTDDAAMPPQKYLWLELKATSATNMDATKAATAGIVAVYLQDFGASAALRMEPFGPVYIGTSPTDFSTPCTGDWPGLNTDGTRDDTSTGSNTAVRPTRVALCPVVDSSRKFIIVPSTRHLDGDTTHAYFCISHLTVCQMEAVSSLPPAAPSPYPFNPPLGPPPSAPPSAPYVHVVDSPSSPPPPFPPVDGIPDNFCISSISDFDGPADAYDTTSSITNFPHDNAWDPTRHGPSNWPPLWINHIFDGNQSTLGCNGRCEYYDANSTCKPDYPLNDPDSKHFEFQLKASGGTNGVDAAAGTILVYLSDYSDANYMTPFEATVQPSGTPCSPSGITDTVDSIGGRTFLVVCRVSAADRTIKIASTSRSLGPYFFCIAEAKFCRLPQTPISPPPSPSHPPPSPPYRPRAQLSLEDKCIPTAAQQGVVATLANSASSSEPTEIPASTIGLEAWSVAHEHNTPSLGIWKGFDNDQRSLGCSVTSLESNTSDPTSSYMSFTIPANNGTNGIDAASTSHIFMYATDYPDSSYLTPFAAYVGSGPNVRTTQCIGVVEQATPDSPAGKNYLLDCPITQTDRTITLGSAYRSGIANTFFCVAEAYFCADQASAQARLSPVTSFLQPPSPSPPPPPLAPLNYAPSTVDLGTENVLSCQPGYTQIDSRRGCQLALNYVNSVTHTHALYDATTTAYSRNDLPAGCYALNLAYGLGQPTDPSPIVFSSTTGTGALISGLTALCRHTPVKEPPSPPLPSPSLPPPSPRLPIGSTPGTPPPPLTLPPPSLPPKTCTVASVATDVDVAEVTLQSVNRGATNDLFLRSLAGDMVFTFNGGYSVAGNTPVIVNLRVTLPAVTSSAQVGGASFEATKRDIPSASHFIAVHDNAMCLRYRLNQSNPCTDVLSTGPSTSAFACRAQQAMEMSISISRPGGSSLQPPGNLFVTAHSVSSSTFGRRLVWLKSENSVYSYTADLSNLRSASTMQSDGLLSWFSTQAGSPIPATRGPTSGDTLNSGVFVLPYSSYEFTIGVSHLLAETEGPRTIEDEACFSFSKPSLLEESSCDAPYAEDCCKVIEVEGSGSLAFLTGKFVKARDSFLGRTIYRRSPSRAGMDNNVYDELFFTHKDCAHGFPDGLPSLPASADRYVTSGWPSGLGIKSTLRYRGLRPFDDQLIDNAGTRQFDVTATMADFTGLKGDSITGSALSPYPDISSVPADVCTNSAHPQALRSSMYYYASGGAHLLQSFDAANGVASFQNGFLFENCQHDLFCLGDAITKCDLSPTPLGAGGSITKWQCAI